MLAECERHGYYRDEVCPVCNKKGRFLMNDREVNALSRILAGALRHFPERFGLNMDGHGWVEISALVETLKDSRSGFHWLQNKHIEAIALTDPRGRYQVSGDMIRATYGHTVDVNLDDLPLADKDELYYPVTPEEAEIVLEGGLHPTDRKMVHLSGSVEKALEAGRVRTENPVILRIDCKKALEDNVKIYHAGKDVYIVESIDAKYISLLEEDLNKEKKD